MKTEEIFIKNGLHPGRMISGSKSGYRSRYPDSKVVFNGNIIIKSAGKVWWGDIDVTLEEAKLQAVANELKEDLYILYEMDARFGNEEKPVDELMSRACAVIKYAE